MPAKSKSQQKLMGMVHAYQKGDLDTSGMSADLKKKIRKAAKSMTSKDSKKFASTKHKGLPEKVKENAKGLTFKQFLIENVIQFPGNRNRPDSNADRDTPKDSSTKSDVHDFLPPPGKTKSKGSMGGYIEDDPDFKGWVVIDSSDEYVTTPSHFNTQREAVIARNEYVKRTGDRNVEVVLDADY